MMILSIVIYIVWVGSEISLSLFKRSGDDVKKKADKGSLGMIWMIVLIANVLSYYVSRSIPMEISDNQNIRFVGLAIILLGVVLRLSIVLSLGKFFTVNVVIAEDHKLKTDGFYRYVRHPSYAASILSFAGYGVSLNNWLSLLIVVAAVGGVFIYRIGLEEQTLIEHFGDQYLEYKRTTKRLIPFVY